MCLIPKPTFFGHTVLTSRYLINASSVFIWHIPRPFPALNFPLPKATGKMALQAVETCRRSLQVLYVRNNVNIPSRYINIRRKKMLRTILMENGKVTLEPWLTWKSRLNCTKCFYLIFTQMPIGYCSEPKPEKYGFQELQWEFKIKK